MMRANLFFMLVYISSSDQEACCTFHVGLQVVLQTNVPNLSKLFLCSPVCLPHASAHCSPFGYVFILELKHGHQKLWKYIMKTQVSKGSDWPLCKSCSFKTVSADTQILCVHIYMYIYVHIHITDTTKLHISV